MSGVQFFTNGPVQEHVRRIMESLDNVNVVKSKYNLSPIVHRGPVNRLSVVMTRGRVARPDFD
jgi:hypothetical protein